MTNMFASMRFALEHGCTCFRFLLSTLDFELEVNKQRSALDALQVFSGLCTGPYGCRQLQHLFRLDLKRRSARPH